MNKQRKEVHLDPKTVKALEKLAKQDNRKLKPYLEKVLIEHVEKSNQTTQSEA